MLMMLIYDKIVTNPAVDSCADNACPIGALKVAFHDLVQFSITQTLKYQYQYKSHFWANM